MILPIEIHGTPKWVLHAARLVAEIQFPEPEVPNNSYCYHHAYGWYRPLGLVVFPPKLPNAQWGLFSANALYAN